MIYITKQCFDVFRKEENQMKKIVSLALALCLIVGVMLSLTSCFGAIPSGTYTIGNSKTEIEVKGSKMTMKEEIMGVEIGFVLSYKVSGEEITIKYEKAIYDGDSETIKGLIADMETEFAEEFEGTFDFEKGDGFFKMDGVTYNKK